MTTTKRATITGPAAHRRAMAFAAPVAALALTIPVRGGAVRAQDDQPSHPAHIHAGTCDELGEVVFPLPNLTTTGVIDGMMAMATEDPPAATPAAARGPASAVPAKASWSFVDAGLTEIIEGGHAINVHESEENIGDYIACGDIGGQVTNAPGEEDGEGVLVIGLRELNDSGHTGIAVLQALEADRTWVQVYVSPVLEEGAAAAGDDAAVAAAGAAVTIVDFAYSPAEVTIPVGGTVTWTNDDPTAHTATGQNGADFKSGTLDQGETFDRTFDEAGTYEYRCEFHANMNGTVVVE